MERVLGCRAERGRGVAGAPAGGCRCPRAAARKGRRGHSRRRAARGPLAGSHQPSARAGTEPALLDGPFPRRWARPRRLRRRAAARVRTRRPAPWRSLSCRQTGASVVRIPVDWRETVAPDPPAGFDAARPGRAPPTISPARRSGQSAAAGRPAADARRLPRAAVRRSARALAVRVSRRPGRRARRALRRVRGSARAPLRRQLSRPARAGPHAARGEATSRPGTSRTWPATWSPSGWSRTGAGAPSRRCSTASC